VLFLAGELLTPSLRVYPAIAANPRAMYAEQTVSVTRTRAGPNLAAA